MKEMGLYCPECQKNTLHRQEEPAHTVHALLTIFTCLIWGICWMILAFLYSREPWLCSTCGTPVKA